MRFSAAAPQRKSRGCGYVKNSWRLPRKPGEEVTSRLMEPQCKSSGAGASESSRKSREAGGASRRRHERRQNACHLLPGFTVLDVPLGQGQIRTEPDTRPHSQADLNQQGWERRIKALVSASNRVPLVSLAELRGPWGTQDSGRAAGLDRLTPRSLPALGSPVVERGPWKDSGPVPLTDTACGFTHTWSPRAQCVHSTHRQADCNCTWPSSVQALLSLRRPQEQRCQSRLEATAQTLRGCTWRAEPGPRLLVVSRVCSHQVRLQAASPAPGSAHCTDPLHTPLLQPGCQKPLCHGRQCQVVPGQGSGG